MKLVNTKRVKIKQLVNSIFKLLPLNAHLFKMPGNLGNEERIKSCLSLSLQDSHSGPWAKLLKSSSIKAMPIKHLVRGP